MSRLTISDLSGGVVDAVDGQKIPDNCLVEAVNYEYVNGTELVRRKNIGLSIDLHIPNLRSFSVWYPTNNLIDNIDKHICIADNGQTISLYYRTNETGYHAVISLFSDVGDNVSYFVSADRVLIADGLNRCRYVSINIDGEVASGTLGIPSPTNKVQISIEENDNRYVIVNPAEGLPNNDIGMGRERGNILGVCYTVEDEIGNESNPSPVNYEQRLMYKYPTADTDIGYQYFWAKATYKGLKIPVVSDTVVSDTVVERLKYYNIYVTDTDYTSGTYGKSFVLVARVRIVSPDGQTYSDTSKEKLKSIDYTNNPSPVASTVIESNNVIFVGNIKDKINFPFEFDSYTAITINNQNDRDYVNAVIAISIKGSDVGIESFSDIDTHKKRYRIFASDRITPINVIYKNVGNTELRCYLRIPMLNRGVNTIYFCYYTGEGKVALKPSIIVTETLETFYALEDGYSAVQNYTVEGYALSATSYIVIVPPVKFEISANGTTDWKTSTDSLEVAPSGAVTVYVRFAPTEVGDVTGHINHSNITSGCIDVDTAVEGATVVIPQVDNIMHDLRIEDGLTWGFVNDHETWHEDVDRAISWTDQKEAIDFTPQSGYSVDIKLNPLRTAGTNQLNGIDVPYFGKHGDNITGSNFFNMERNFAATHKPYKGLTFASIFKPNSSTDFGDYTLLGMLGSHNGMYSSVGSEVLSIRFAPPSAHAPNVLQIFGSQCLCVGPVGSHGEWWDDAYMVTRDITIPEGLITETINGVVTLIDQYNVIIVVFDWENATTRTIKTYINNTLVDDYEVTNWIALTAPIFNADYMFSVRVGCSNNCTRYFDGNKRIYWVHSR
jgi:hypothetical protein